MAQVLIVAPQWSESANVAQRRLADIQRWLNSQQHQVSIVSAGGAASSDTIIVEDPRAIRGDLRRVDAVRFSRLRRWARELRYLPDEGVPWARRVAADPRVRALASQADLILSSSPPESAHLAAHWIAGRAGKPHWVDLQDGWIDEPLRLSLVEFRWRRHLEARLEARILRSACLITVTTEVWRRLLLTRYPQLAERIHSIALAPPPLQLPKASPHAHEGRLQLLHAGSFSLSHYRRQMSLLLEPLLAAAATAGPTLRSRILLLGDLHPAEIASLPQWAQRFAVHDWRVEHATSLPRDRYFEILAGQHGLLLLSASMGALPSKLFEYVALGRPLLVLAAGDSAAWNAAQECPSAHRVDYRHAAPSDILPFLRDAAERELSYPAPPQLSEAVVRSQLLELVAPLLAPR